MYNVKLNGRTSTSVSSYEKAVGIAKASAPAVADAIRARAAAIASNPRLFRSPKARHNVSAALLRTAEKAADALKFPKKAADVSVNVGGVSLAIVRA